MLKDIMLTLKLRLSYKINAIIHSFRTIPVIGKNIPYNIYSLYDLKLVFSILLFIILLFGYPLLCFLLCLFINIIAPNSILFAIIFFISTVLINLIKPLSFRADRDSDYAINSLQMNAKRYLLNNYLYKTIMQLFGLIIGMFFVYIVDSVLIFKNISFMYVFLLPVLYISIRTITANINISFIKKSLCSIIYYIILILSSLVLIFVYIKQPNFISILFNIYIIIYTILGILSFIRLLLFKKYHYVFKYLYNKKLAKKSLKEVDIENMTNVIDTSTKITSNKHDYDLLHDLFVKRHSKILLQPIVGYSILELIIIIATIIAMFMIPESKNLVNQLFTKYSLYFLAFMYFINRGEKLSKAMFMNCDHAMLTYRIYRNPRVILEMFKRRLKTTIGLNLIPAIILSIGCLIILIINNDSITNVILFPLSLIFISVFFSVHNLVLYYLLQPYNSSTEEKSKSYRIARTITYVVVVYPAIYFDVTLSAEIFSIICLTVSFIYVIVSLFIVNKFAPKTFKIYH